MAIKKVYLIRHGQTKGNAEKRYVGKRTDEPLSDDGKWQITECRGRYEALLQKTDRIAASPMERAVKTAELLFDSPNLFLIEELSEMDFGIFEGRNYKELNGNELYQTWIDEGGKGQIPEGENFDGFCSRSCEGFRKAMGDPKQPETIVIVCHGGTIMAILSDLTGEAYYGFMTENLGGYYLELECSDEGSRLISYDRFLPGDPP